MNRVISAEFYKIRHCKLLWFLPIVFFALGFYCAADNFEVYGLYNRLELFVLPTLADLYLTVGTAMLAGYVIGMDFSFRTIQNTLSVGVSRRSYYFSRMGVLMFLTALLYGIAMLGFVCGRLPLFQTVINPTGIALLPGNRPELELFWIKLAVYAAIVILQLWAYVSVLTALCFFIKKQLPLMVAGLALIIIELELRQLADQYNITFLRYLFDFAPVRVLKNAFEVYAMHDEVLTLGFLKFGVSALVIIAVSSAAGFCRFRYDWGNA